MTELNKPSMTAAYSIDAGFHVFVFTLKQNEENVLAKLHVLKGINKIIKTSVDKEGV